MPFDPTLPAPNSQILSSVLRDQYNGLFTICQGLDQGVNSSAWDPTGVNPLSLSISNPPTQAQVEAVRDKVNELLAALHK